MRGLWQEPLLVLRWADIKLDAPVKMSAWALSWVVLADTAAPNWRLELVLALELKPSQRNKCSDPV
jgi:hypothetical protein